MRWIVEYSVGDAGHERDVVSRIVEHPGPAEAVLRENVDVEAEDWPIESIDDGRGAMAANPRYEGTNYTDAWFVARTDEEPADATV